MDVLDVATGALIVLALFDWLVVIVLARVARAARAKPGGRIRTLEERGRISTAIAAASTIGVLLGVNRHLSLGIPVEATILLLVVVVLLPSLANLWFLVDLLRGEFGA